MSLQECILSLVYGNRFLQLLRVDIQWQKSTFLSIFCCYAAKFPSVGNNDNLCGIECGTHA